MSKRNDIEKKFLEKIDKHQGILHRIGFVYAKNSTDKEDLYQEMILQLWKSYTSFQGKSTFSTWMYRVALNTAITFAKKKFFLFERLEPNIEMYEFDQTMEYSEEIKLLYKAISSLNTVEKAIILMWLDDKSYDEIATTIGISVKNVSVKIVRIKLKLEKIIERIS